MKEFFQNHQLLLAPMAGVSDEAFRLLCSEQGASLTYTEMVSAKGLSYANAKTRSLLYRFPQEKQVAVQLFGHEPLVVARQAAWVEREMGKGLAYIDLNMGCPVRKMVSKGDGSALMKDPLLAAALVKAVVGAVNHPVTVKFRRGWAKGKETAVDFGRRLEEAGACAVVVHGRYAEQLYQGRANWDVIARVKEALSIPVIGNGDVCSGADAVALRVHTHCDSVMIARAAEGNPWIFAQAKAALAGRPEPPKPSVLERLEMAQRHIHLQAKRTDGSLVRMRKHAVWYMAGFPGASAVRRKINSCTTLADFDALFDELIAFTHEKSA